MASPLHSKQTVTDGIHTAIAILYPNAAARTTATGFVPEDQYKLALQQDDNSVWVLLSGSNPPVWAAATVPVDTVFTGSHETLRQLVHLAEEGGPFEGFPSVVRDIGPVGQAFPTASIWWVDVTRQQKIVEKIITRNAHQFPVTVQWKVYVSGSNAVAASFTDTLSYFGPFETSRTRTSP